VVPLERCQEAVFCIGIRVILKSDTRFVFLCQYNTLSLHQFLPHFTRNLISVNECGGAISSCYSVRGSCSRNQLDRHARFHPCNPVACGKVDCGDSGQGDSVLGATYATERLVGTMCSVCIPFVIPSTIHGSYSAVGAVRTAVRFTI